VTQSTVTVNHPEQWASAIGGAALMVWGANRLANRGEPLAALLATTAGAGLIWRARPDETRVRLAGARGTIVEEAVGINRSPHELYAFWRDLEHLPTVIPALRSVRILDGRRSQWVAARPAGWRSKWTAEIINDVPNELIAWRTIRGADVVSAGSVHFEPGLPSRGTIVRVKLQYDPPAGKLGAAVAWALGDSPARVIREGLRRFKQLMETGEIATTAGQPRGGR
jgi:uncharacterized membrane protein